MPGETLGSPEAAAVAELLACLRLMRRGGGPTPVLAVADRVAAMSRDRPGSPVLSAAQGYAAAAVVAAGSLDPALTADLSVWSRVLGLALQVHCCVGE